MDTLFQDYGLWPIVIIGAGFIIAVAKSLVQPKTPRDWRALGGFAAFIVALFTEMYGFPLTIYLFSGWLTSKFPDINFFAHNSGHLLETLFGWRANPHFGPFHVVSIVLIFYGFSLLSKSWKVLYHSQLKHVRATCAERRTRCTTGIWWCVGSICARHARMDSTVFSPVEAGTI